MSNTSHREKADAARAAAAASDLPNVRERELRSAGAYDGLAERDERVAAASGKRQAAAAAAREHRQIDCDEGN